MTVETDVRDQVKETASMREPANPVFTILNGLLHRFASALLEGRDAAGGDRMATLRSAAGDAVLELTTRAGSLTGRYLFHTQNTNGVAAMLSGSFIADAAILNTLARELRSLVHDCWVKA
jgi:hypothetical protein